MTSMVYGDVIGKRGGVRREHGRCGIASAEADVIELVGTTASLVESIAFHRKRRSCAWGNEHDTYRITHAGRDGSIASKAQMHCFHPCCDTRPRRFSHSPSYVLLSSWVGWPPPSVVAVAYLLVFDPPRQEVIARVGIYDQWDLAYGNNCSGELLGRRYFAAESGPGVYPAEIREWRDE